MGNIDFTVKVCDGKYEYRQYKDGSSDATRNGEPWQDLTGNKFVFCLAWELNEARERVAEIVRELDRLREELAERDREAALENESKVPQ